ncbi:MAG: heme exporter protein CcmD [Kiloniellales bacterium]|nr:heme exporter protein CcmD [Kiloniellales bacterium]
MSLLQDFLAMGGYGGYVWPAYALSAVVLIGFAVTSLRDLRAAERALAKQEAKQPDRRRRKAARA